MGGCYEKVHSDLPSSKFEKPSNIVTAKICKASGKVATDACTDTYTEYFVKGTIPEYCEGHEKLTICKETGKLQQNSVLRQKKNICEEARKGRYKLMENK